VRITDATGSPVKPQPGLVALAFQSPENQLFGASVFEDVAFGPRRLGLAREKSELQILVAEALARVGLPFAEYSQRSPFTLSGGEARRVAIAGVLAMRPRLLLLDEPTAGLDARAREQLMRLIRDVADAGTTVLVTSHDRALFEPWVDALVSLVSPGSPGSCQSSHGTPSSNRPASGSDATAGGAAGKAQAQGG
jgi:energy-coupling factor transport system ATP-binding protein